MAFCNSKLFDICVGCSYDLLSIPYHSLMPRRKQNHYVNGCYTLGRLLFIQLSFIRSLYLTVFFNFASRFLSESRHLYT